MSAFLLVCVGLFATVSSTTPISKCDPNIKKCISDYQNLHGCPSNLIQVSANNGVEFVMRTTEGYVADDVTCIFTKTIPNADYTHATLEVYTVDSDKKTSHKSIEVVEEGGALYYPTNKVERKVVWSNNYASSVYVCSKDANAPEGPPTFFVKCATGHCSDANVQEGVDAIEYLGYSVPQRYSTCETECD